MSTPPEESVSAVLERYEAQLLVILAANAGAEVQPAELRAAVLGALECASLIVEVLFTELPTVIRAGYEAWK